MMNQAASEPLEIIERVSRRLEQQVSAERRFNTSDHALDQEVINDVFKQLDDMFLRLFCMGNEKADIERFKEKSIASIVGIKKNLNRLGLKFKDEI